MFEAFAEYIQRKKLFEPSASLLIAVSGGVDSVVLTHLCSRLPNKISIAHCNFQLRGDESNRDEDFVRALAQQLKVNFYTIRFDTAQYCNEHRMGIQEGARKLRYDWFYDIIEGRVLPETSYIDTRPELILTAHHADDDIETFFMHIMRSSGISGLKGIAPKQGKLIRPLLAFHKSSLLSYAEREGVRFIEDSSNLSDKYQRNFFRLKVLPVIEERYPAFPAGLQQSLSHLKDAEWLYQQQIMLYKKQLLEAKDQLTQIPVYKLLKTPVYETILLEIIKDFEFLPSQLSEVLRLLDSQSGKWVASATHKIIRNRNWLVIQPLQQQDESLVVIDAPGEYEFQNGKLRVEEADMPDSLHTEADVIYVPSDMIRFPLLLRKWKAGDYFYPFGMQKKKKIARFLIDQKMSMPEKERVWVLEMQQKVIWLTGIRQDDRFKVLPHHHKVYKISVTKG